MRQLSLYFYLTVYSIIGSWIWNGGMDLNFDLLPNDPLSKSAKEINRHRITDGTCIVQSIISHDDAVKKFMDECFSFDVAEILILNKSKQLIQPAIAEKLHSCSTSETMNIYLVECMESGLDEAQCLNTIADIQFSCDALNQNNAQDDIRPKSYLANGICFIRPLNNDERAIKINDHPIKTLGEVYDELLSNVNYRQFQIDDISYGGYNCGNSDVDSFNPCRGRIDNCLVSGPSWNIKIFDDDRPILSDVTLMASKIDDADIIPYGQWWARTIASNNYIWINGFNTNVVGIVEYIDLLHPFIDTDKIISIDSIANDEKLTIDHIIFMKHSKFIGVKNADEIESVIYSNRR